MEHETQNDTNSNNMSSNLPDDRTTRPIRPDTHREEKKTLVHRVAEELGSWSPDAKTVVVGRDRIITTLGETESFLFGFKNGEELVLLSGEDESSLPGALQDRLRLLNAMLYHDLLEDNEVKRGKPGRLFRPEEDEKRVFQLLPVDRTVPGRLSPAVLRDLYVPYLDGLEQLQNLLLDLSGRRQGPAHIHSITQKSPVSVSMSGVTEATTVVQEMVIPWRREHAETMAVLEEQEKRVEIELRRAEVLEKRAGARVQREMVRRAQEEVARLSLENEKLRLDLEQAKVELALSILDRLDTRFNDEQRMVYMMRVLQVMETILTSPLDYELLEAWRAD